MSRAAVVQSRGLVARFKDRIYGFLKHKSYDSPEVAAYMAFGGADRDLAQESADVFTGAGVFDIPLHPAFSCDLVLAGNFTSLPAIPLPMDWCGSESSVPPHVEKPQTEYPLWQGGDHSTGWSRKPEARRPLASLPHRGTPLALPAPERIQKDTEFKSSGSGNDEREESIKVEEFLEVLHETTRLKPKDVKTLLPGSVKITLEDLFPDYETAMKTTVKEPEPVFVQGGIRHG